MASGTRGAAAASNPSSTTGAKPVSVLFVCLGNICRSPMAEGVFRDITRFGTAEQHPLISHIDSCGTAAYHSGSQPDSRTLSVLAARGQIDDYKHKARKVKVPSDFEQFDYVLAMDEANLIDLRDMAKRAVSKAQLSAADVDKIQLYGAFGGKAADEEVQDPYYGGRDGFETSFEQVQRFGRGLLKHIEQQAGTKL